MRPWANGRDGVRFHAGVEYRHLLVVPESWTDAECTPPHDLTGQAAVFPSGASAPKLNALMDASRAVVRDAAARRRFARDADLAVGPGCEAGAAVVRGDLRRARRGCRRRSISCRASVCSPASRSSTFPARPPGFDNDYGAQARACIRLARGSRPLRAAHRSDRRGRAPGSVRHQGRRARTLGRRGHRPGRRRARSRRASRTGSC